MPSGAAPIVGHVVVDPLVVAVDPLITSALSETAKTFDREEGLGSPVQGDVFIDDQPLVVSSTGQVRARHQRRATGAHLTKGAAAQEGPAEPEDPNGWFV